MGCSAIAALPTIIILFEGENAMRSVEMIDIVANRRTYWDVGAARVRRRCCAKFFDRFDK